MFWWCVKVNGFFRRWLNFSFIKKYTPKENSVKNALIAFFVGGLIGSAGELLLGVLAIAAIFFIKKYLMPYKDKDGAENQQRSTIKSIIASYLKDNDENVSMF